MAMARTPKKMDNHPIHLILLPTFCHPVISAVMMSPSGPID
jgi:hypothetical protein